MGSEAQRRYLSVVAETQERQHKLAAADADVARLHEALALVLNVPSEHKLHAAWPDVEVYLPLGHASHEVEPV